MNTLVIHPQDVTTDCLSVIYENRDWDVVRDFEIKEKDLRELIKSHDRIIMLGHGTPQGLLAGGYLLGPNKGFTRFHHFIIQGNFVDILRGKETFSIWCNSDQFFRKYNLPGLHTGMIISEVSEEYYCLGRAWLDEEGMAKNMELFCGTFAKYVDLSPNEMREKVLGEYIGDDPVTKFNRERIIVL